jgi:hypothetical protein
MFNPLGSDTDREWIEIYNNGSAVNLNDMQLVENNVSHRLELIWGNEILETEDYAVIANDATQFIIDYPDFNGILLDSSFSLSNSGEVLELEANEEILDSIFYNGSTCGEGRALSFFNESWFCSKELNGTPGIENEILDSTISIPEEKQGLKLSVYLEDILFLGETFTNLFKIENIDHVSGTTDHINVTIWYNISGGFIGTLDISDINSYVTSNTGNFTPLISGTYTICGWIVNASINDTNKEDDLDCKEIVVVDTSMLSCDISIKLVTNKTIYNQSEPIKFQNIISNESFPFIIEYWAEDLFGNFIKNKYNTTNTNQKSFIPSFEGKELAVILKNRLYPLCNDSDISDNTAQQLVVVKGTEPKKESSIEILDVMLGSDNKVKFGESFTVKLRIYKGDETKNQILSWMEDSVKVSDTTSAMLYSKFTEYEITIPIQLKSDCKETYKNKAYTLVIEGLDIRKEQFINIEGHDTSLCSTKSSTSPNSDSTSDQPSFTYNIASIPDLVESNKEFQVQIELSNYETEPTKIELWSYVYRGSKSYSGDRESNKKIIEIPGRSSISVPLENKALDAEDGSYKLKVKIRKDDQKTEKELTQDITLYAGKPEVTKPIQNTSMEKEIIYNPLNKSLLYESTTYKAKKLVPYFLILVFGGLVVYLILKKL